MRRLRFVIVVLCLGLWPRVVMAQVVMETQVGLQGTVRLEKWNPLTVHLQNTGVPLVGTLGVRVWRGSEFRQDLQVTTFTQMVKLPSRSRKRFTFVIPLTSITHPVEIFLQQGATIIARQRLSLRQALNAEYLILGVTRDLGLDFLATTFQRHTRVVYLTPEALPQRWSGYDSVSAMIVKGISLQSLTAKQSIALRQWIVRGGVLVVSGDSQYGLLQESRLRTLLPVQVLGIQQLVGLPAFAKRYGVPLPAVPALVLHARLLRGRVVVGTASAPLLAERNFGEGRVVFLAVDYAAQPLAGWRGRPALWKDILQPAEGVDFRKVFAELGLLDEAHPIIKLFSRPLLNYPSHMILSLFLVGYCSGLGLLLWRLGKRRVRRVRYGRYWMGVVAFVIGATGGAYGFFPERSLRQPAMVIDMTTMEIFPDTGYAHVRGYLGLFSPRGGRYTLTFQHPETILRHTFHRGKGRAEPTMEITATGPFTIRGVTLGPWGLRIFSTESVVSAPVQVTAWEHATGLMLQVKNRSLWPLQGTMVAYRGQLFSIGTIAAGEEILKDFSVSSQPSVMEHETIWQMLFTRRLHESDVRVTYSQEVLLQKYFGEKRLRETKTMPFLVGWFMVPMSLRRVSTVPAVQGVALVVSRFRN